MLPQTAPAQPTGITGQLAATAGQLVGTAGQLAGTAGQLAATAGQLVGTPSPIEWAVQIRPRVADEFDRVAKAFHETAAHQTEPDRIETLALIAVLEEKRAEVLANHRAGYYIRDWQELSGRVRQIIAQDPRYLAIRAAREARRQLRRPGEDSASDSTAKTDS